MSAPPHLTGHLETYFGGRCSVSAERTLRRRPSAARGFKAGGFNAIAPRGSEAYGLDVGGRKLPYAPEFTAYGGAQYSWRPRADTRLFVRAQATVSGRFAYDASNAAAQGAYAVPDLRFGAEARRWFAEVSVSNLTGTDTVPIALPFSTAFAPSGYVGESGAPATFAVRAGLRF